MDEVGEKAYYLWLEARDKVKELEGKIDKIRQHIDDVENRKDVNVRLQHLLIDEIKKILEK